MLSEVFLAGVRELPQKNLALEILRKLLNDQIAVRARQNVVESRAFSERLQRAIIQYQNRAIDSAEALQQLIELAREMREAHQRGERLGLGEDELAFYDALEVNDSIVNMLGDATLCDIARELVQLMRQNVTVDWTVRETARATCVSSSSACCASTTIHLRSRTKQRRRSSSRRRRSVRIGQRLESHRLPCRHGVRHGVPRMLCCGWRGQRFTDGSAGRDCYSQGKGS